MTGLGDDLADSGPGLFGDALPATGKAEAYRVLARKYRPTNFADLVGQEAMVRTLSNAFDTGRIAHAFLLTGVRGIGKTTTARIIAKALNCIGPDSLGGPTIAPCDQCDPCRSIAASRHMDVMEMDAASRTGIGDIRELIDGVNYLPASARYKVYIIDEVHMLSNAAFNGLLKTLEEPPPHVKFIFATTELRKIPITVLSRCQRFDLKRLDQPTMIAHLNRIAQAEGIVVDQTAQGLLARAAEGSVRDGLSLLDQAIAHAGTEIDADTVRAMLGLSDRTRVFDLFRAIMSGEIAQALAEIRAQYDAGADPQAILRDLLDLTHFLTRIKIVAEAADDVTLAENERHAARDLAARLTMPVLARAWQLLLKGFGEVRDAPSPIAAAEMLVVRLAYAADLPNPADLVRQLKDQGPVTNGQARAPAAPPQGSAPRMSATGTGGSQAMASPAPAAATAKAMPANIEALAELAGTMRDGQLKYQIENHMHVVRFERGRIEFRPTERAPQSLAADLTAKISNWTGERWIVSISNATGQATLAEQKRAAEQAMRLEIRNHPLVAEALTHFPDAELMDVRDMVQAAAPVLVDEPDDFGEDRPLEGSIDPYEDAED
jgi:DNA polymerase-3 subunit gamma/tau